MKQTLYDRLVSLDKVTQNLERLDAESRSRLNSLSLPADKQSQLLALLDPPQELNSLGQRMIIEQYAQSNQLVQEALLGYIDFESELTVLEDFIPSVLAGSEHKKRFQSYQARMAEVLSIPHVQVNHNKTVPQMFTQASAYIVGSTALGIGISYALPSLFGVEGKIENEQIVHIVGSAMGMLGGVAMYLADSYKIEQARERAHKMARYLDSKVKTLYHSK
ncbi:MAG TPA: hypothetical protein VK158_06185 [Acidobacteriota bacterium]|nr:hypothetical protein [Acidobacteriota bacterium]